MLSRPVPLRSVAATVFVAGLVAVLLTVLGAPAGARAGTADTEAVIARLLADERARAGVGVAARSAELDDVAREWARRQAADGRMQHNPDLRDQVQPARAWYENVGHLRGVPSSVSFRDAGERLHETWMASEGHRANILRHPLTDVGIGVASADDAIYVAVVFRWQGVSAGPAPEPAPSAAAEEETGGASTASTSSPPTPRPTPTEAPTGPAEPPPATTPDEPLPASSPAPAPTSRTAASGGGVARDDRSAASHLDRRLGTDHASSGATARAIAVDGGAPGGTAEADDGRPPVELQVVPDVTIGAPAGGQGRLAVPLVLGASAVAAAVVVGASRPGHRGR